MGWGLRPRRKLIWFSRATMARSISGICAATWPSERLRARRLQGGGRSALEPAVEEVVGVLEGGGRALGDLELRRPARAGPCRRRPRPRPATGGRRGAPLRSPGIRARAASLRRRMRPQRSSSHEKPTSTDHAVSASPARVEDRVRAARCHRALVVDGGKQLGADDAVAGARLLDPGRGQPGVEAVADRLLDESLQDRVVEDVPPGHVRQRARLGRALLAVELRSGTGTGGRL